ncbi:MAG: hypothetical protein WA414_02395 [Acidobacteriaceae bacterium]
MKPHSLLFVPFFAACVATAPAPADAQAAAGGDVTPVSVSAPAPVPPDLTYERPTELSKFRSYSLATFGPFPIAVGLGEATEDQFENSPPEWKQGTVGFSKRFGSDFGMLGVSTTTRYVLAEALREDTRYYRCACTGLFPRFRYAVFSTLTARQGDDGHRIFSIPALVAPYAGSTTAVYGWFPDRYGAKDAFRMGNYNLLGAVGSSLWFEFIYPHSRLARLHAAPLPAPQAAAPNH